MPDGCARELHQSDLPSPQSPGARQGTGPTGSRLAILATLCRIVVGAFFLLAAGAKLALGDDHGVGVTYGLRTFAAVIAGHTIIPVAASYAAAAGVVAIEVLLGLWLLSHARVKAAVLATIALTLAFSIYLIAAYLRVGDAPCGCMGKLTSGKLSEALVRNVGMVAILLPSLLVRPRQKPRL